MALLKFFVTNVIILLKTLLTKKSFEWNLQDASQVTIGWRSEPLVIAPVYLWP